MSGSIAAAVLALLAGAALESAARRRDRERVVRTMEAVRAREHAHIGRRLAGLVRFVAPGVVALPVAYRMGGPVGVVLCTNCATKSMNPKRLSGAVNCGVRSSGLVKIIRPPAYGPWVVIRIDTGWPAKLLERSSIAVPLPHPASWMPFVAAGSPS